MKDDGLSVDVSYVDGVATLTMIGELDAVSLPTLRASLETIQSAKDVALDMDGVEFIDSTGLRLIWQRAMRMIATGGTLSITTASPQVARLLRITNFDGLLARDSAA